MNAMHTIVPVQAAIQLHAVSLALIPTAERQARLALRGRSEVD